MEAIESLDQLVDNKFWVVDKNATLAEGDIFGPFDSSEQARAFQKQDTVVLTTDEVWNLED